jgi:hypothetical protein
MDSLRFLRARALACVILLPAAVGACGTVWGFQSATLEPEDASLDGTTQNDSGSAGDSTRPDSGSAQDAPGVDSTVDVGQTDTSSEADSAVPSDSSPPQDADASDTSVADTGSDSGSDAQHDTGPPPQTCGDASLCAPTVTGWTGPVAMYEGSSPPPTCPSTYGNDVYNGNLGLDAGPATCSDCTCTPQAATCAPVSMTVFTKCGAGGTNCGSILLGAGQCSPEPNCGLDLTDPYWVATVTASALSGDCAPGGGVATTTESWAMAARACAPTSDAGAAECTAGNVCIPNLTPPFSGICIFAPGDLSCPSPYSSPNVYYSGTMDTRGCGACACGSIMGTCSGTIDDHTTTCGSAVADTVPIPSTCAEITKIGVGGSQTSQATLTPMASCAPPMQLVPMSTGSDSPKNPTTVCCL